MQSDRSVPCAMLRVVMCRKAQALCQSPHMQPASPHYFRCMAMCSINKYSITDNIFDFILWGYIPKKGELV